MLDMSKLTVLFNNANFETDIGVDTMLSYVMENGGKHRWNNSYGLYSRVVDRGSRVFCVDSKRDMHKNALASLGYYPTVQGKKSDSDFLASLCL